MILGAMGIALAQRAEVLFDQNCATCHEVGNAARSPDRKALRKLTPEAIYASLTTGSMRERAQNLQDAQRQSLAESLGGRKLGVAQIGDARRMPNQCPANSAFRNPSASAAWNGWGTDLANSRFQPAAAARLAADQVPQLKLKWAFGLPGATSVYGQPSVVAGRVFVGADSGYLYSIDAATGCVYWSFLAQGGVRNAASVGLAGPGKYAVYFGDMKANVYALNASTGELLWTVSADDHPIARVTGSPSLYGNRLYVPVASAEEPAGVGENYPCCTFRGSVVALDAANGRRIWKTYTISESPKPTRKNSKGAQRWAPAGGGVWNSPTIAPKNTDSILALDMDTGKILWAVQDTPNDAWLAGCPPAQTPENCPKNLGPDFDFGSSPILKTLPNGRSILVAGQKSGDVWAHDPDRKGAVLWKTGTTSTPPGPAGQIVWGGAADERNAYFGLNSGGLVALELSNGERRWFAPLDPAPGAIQRHGQDAAVSAIPGVVFSGGWDGVLRALSTSDGRVVWEYNMAREFTTVNGVAGKGGSVGSSGPTIAGGMVFVGSGLIGVQAGMAGNVLLAFSVQ
jgi:polyvinyl alcohol dehydrogenase (cytochrome)